LDVELPVPHAHTRFEQGALTDEEIRASLAEMLEALAAEVQQGEHVTAAA